MESSDTEHLHKRVMLTPSVASVVSIKDVKQSTKRRTGDTSWCWRSCWLGIPTPIFTCSHLASSYKKSSCNEKEYWFKDNKQDAKCVNWNSTKENFKLDRNSGMWDCLTVRWASMARQEDRWRRAPMAYNVCAPRFLLWYPTRRSKASSDSNVYSRRNDSAEGSNIACKGIIQQVLNDGIRGINISTCVNASCCKHCQRHKACQENSCLTW